QQQRGARLSRPCSFAHRLLREAVPPPGLTLGLKPRCEPRRRRRFPEEVMGDEHGTQSLAHGYYCEDPSAAVGSNFLAAGRRVPTRETTTAPGRPFATRHQLAKYQSRSLPGAERGIS